MPAITESKYLVQAGWDDVPHLDEHTKKELLASTPPHLRDARSKGIPSLGSGAIYPVPEDEILVKPFEIPAYWPRVYGLDVGWNKTAAIWGAWDRDNDVVYLHTEHYRGKAEPSIHAEAIKSRGEWIPGVIDPASRGSGQADGSVLLEMYEDLGLDLVKAVNSREAGIYMVYQRLSLGKLKVFLTCQNWMAEYRLYRRNDKGKVVKESDHLMDATRYLIISGLEYASTKPTGSVGSGVISMGSGDNAAGY